jgi:MFS family permease
MPRTPDNNPRAELFRDRNFRWLIGGGSLSLLGDQFTLIALPWLVLAMTGDTLVLGTVLALISVPRALFILVGGAIVDRYSPQRVLMLTKYVNTLLLGVLAALVFTGTLTLPVVYALALGIGLATAFSIPSGTSMMPHVVQPGQLQAANSIQLGLRQLSMFVGPLLAGLLIALFGDGAGGAMANAKGIALAFAFDAFSFALSAWTLSHVVTRPAGPKPAGAAPAVWSSVADGLAYFWRDVELRTLFIYWAAIALLIMGPVHIALPVLASTQPGLGAAAFGIMVGAHGAGTLAGMIASGIKSNLRIGSLGTTILVFDAVIGLLFIPMGRIDAAWQGAGLMLTIGLLGGFMQVAVFTWIQQRVPPAYLGRAMSLFMFIFMGLAPMSAAVTGWVMRGVTLAQLFAACGGALVALAVLAFAGSQLRNVTDARPVPGPRAG